MSAASMTLSRSNSLILRQRLRNERTREDDSQERSPQDQLSIRRLRTAMIQIGIIGLSIRLYSVLLTDVLEAQEPLHFGLARNSISMLKSPR